MDKVSIIIPVYNTPKEFLDECVNSVLKQTYSNYEIIVIDDGSEVDTGAFCDELSLKNKKITVIHKKNEGVAVARNVGIEKATGKWIMFLDSDDYIKEDAIKTLVKESNNADIVISRIIKEEKEKIYGCNEKRIISTIEEKKQLINSMFLDKGNVFMYVDSACAKLYLKKFLDENNIRFKKGLTYGEDSLLNYICYINAKCIKYIPNATYLYRNNTSSVTHNESDNIINANDKLFKEYSNLLDKVNDRELYEGYYCYIVRQINAFCVRHIFNSNNKITNKERDAKLKQVVEREPYKTAIREVKFSSLLIARKIPALLLKLKLYKCLRWLYNGIEYMHGIRDYMYEFKNRKENNN